MTKNKLSVEIFVVLLLALLSGCAVECYPEAYWPNYTNFHVVQTGSSKLGIAVDDPKNELDLEVMDELTQRVLDCLQPLKSQWLSDAEHIEARCEYLKGLLPLRQCMVVKVAPMWHISPCSGEQVFECSVDPLSCADKPQFDPKLCPCSCRAAIQDNGVIVTTPNFRLYPAYLTSLLTSCSYPWTENLAKCAGIKITDPK